MLQLRGVTHFDEEGYTMRYQVAIRRRPAICRLPTVLRLLTFLALLPASTGLSFAQTTIDIHDFYPYPDGFAPMAALVQGGNGNFYGTTAAGGSADAGTVFMVTPSGIITDLHSFTVADGADPAAGLIMGSDGNFYGTTSAGGAYGNGTAYKITPTGVLTTICSISGAGGAVSSLVEDSDGNFYGTTSAGVVSVGSYGGTVFKITPDGDLTTIYSFPSSVSGPVLPGAASVISALVQGSDGNFYGTSSAGGVNSDGTVFMITSGGDLTTLHSFAGADGTEPIGGLVQGSDGNFYGTTNEGGLNSDGTVFMITTGGDLTTLHSFDVTDGSYPSAGLIQTGGGTFYGTTASGGAFGDGTVFQITPAGDLTTIHSFAGADGSEPIGGLLQGSDGNFYGTTNEGGTSGNGLGTVFQITPTGALTDLWVFSGSDGSQPTSLVRGIDGNFYGTTQSGGASNMGAVYRMTPTGVATVVHSFTSSEGSMPCIGLVQGADGDFYGATKYGGASSMGIVFKMTPSGALTTLYSFTGADGDQPQASLVQGSDGNFYGTTVFDGPVVDGLAPEGTVFQITPNGSVTTIHTFTGPDGSNPESSLLLGGDGNFYGTTELGGAHIAGTVFMITSAGDLTTLHSFDVTDGYGPVGDLVEDGAGNVYGTTEDGGVYESGTVFKMTSTDDLTTLHSFAGSDGASPVAGLTQGSDDNFYGTTSAGDNSNGNYGTIFMITPAGELTTLHTFTGSEGADPVASLVQGPSGSFYGTAREGGLHGAGTVFVVEPAGQVLTSIALTPASTLTLTAPATQQFAATALDQLGIPLATQPLFGWSLETGGVGSVNTSGLYHSGPTPGVATVEVKSGSVYATTAVIVNPALATVATAASANPNPVTGTTVHLSVLGGYAGTGGAGVLTYTWSDTGPGLVTFSANNTNAARNATATVKQAGSYTFTVTIDGPYSQSASSSVNVTVNPTLTSIAVSPGPLLTLGPTLPQTQQFAAAVFDQFGNLMSPQPAISWSLESGSVGSLSTGGLYHSGKVAGTATVEVKSGAVSASVAVLVDPPVTVATAANASPNPVTGTTTTLSALGAYAGTGGSATLTYTWSSTGPASVAFSANGTNAAKSIVATFTAAGSYTLTATISSPIGTTATTAVTVTVEQTLTSITLSPGPTLTLGLQQTQQFSASGLDQFGNALATQPAFTWGLASGSVGSVNTITGLYHSGTISGTATVKAKNGTISGTCATTVN